ncbi:LacI family DNA-binding transcriptional regulator [Streptomyces sp. B21-097]|uniref:LacI family DNA-binding transcriptional regulator n=1 Tax=Streptomyces sp. B21-097 TaxID=3039414 RepID=UPI002FF20D06
MRDAPRPGAGSDANGITPPPSAARGRPVVLGDVARRAGVSAMTVSRVLNERPGVGDDTRARVSAVAAELGYRPNRLAQALVTGRSQVLSVVSFDTAQYGPAATVLGVEQAARQAGYAVQITTLRSGDPLPARAVVEGLVSQAVAGLVLAAPHDWTAQALRHLPADRPAVALDVDIEQEGVPVIGLEQTTGARQATEHLLALGHDTVWHVAGPSSRPSARARERAWRDALVAADRTPPHPLRGDWSARSGYEQGRRLADMPGVTAVFAANDQMALGVLRALREAGRDVPGDVSLVGYDDIPEAEYVWPPLTTVRQDFGEAGRCALEVLVAQIEGGPRTGTLVALRPELVVRGSSGPPP